MKKFICSFAFLIYFVFACDFVSHANYLPTVTPQTAVIPDFLQSVTQTQMMENGVYCDTNDLNHLNQIINGRTINDSRSECYIDNANLSQLSDFYDSNGNLIPQEDTFTAFGNSDIGRYMYVADKYTGEILCTTEDLEHLNSTLIASANPSLTFPQFVFEYTTLVPQYLADEIVSHDFTQSDSTMVVYGNNLTQENIAFVEAYDFHYIFHSNGEGWTCYIPNTCSANTVIDGGELGMSFSGNLPDPFYYGTPRIYSNDPSEVYFTGGGAWGYLQRYGSYYLGKHWDYAEGWRNITNPAYNGGYLEYKAPTQVDFDRYNSISDSVVYLQPIVNQGDTNNIYEYTTYINNPPQRQTTVNNNYDNSQPVTNNNYFINNTTTIPDYTPTNNYYETIYNYYTSPQIGGDIGTVDPEDVTDGIPILNNLRYRFPFSIPFDIYDLFSGLAVTRQAPSFDWEIYFPVVDYTWEISFDLSAWDTQAEIFRTCFLILFIIGLAMWSYNHFFGN